LKKLASNVPCFLTENRRVLQKAGALPSKLPSHKTGVSGVMLFEEAIAQLRKKEGLRTGELCRGTSQASLFLGVGCYLSVSMPLLKQQPMGIARAG
jgi:hypothetical protein